MSRLMALDVGEVRIGVAVSDSTRFLASPYTTLYVSSDQNRTWEAIQRLVDEIEPETIIVGLPISLDGQIHAQGERIHAFADQLKRYISIPLVFWDERLSTVEAGRLLAERDGRRERGGRRTHRRRRGHEIDALAATVILQDYLDHLRRKTEEAAQ
jgi:putative Holliday junction resolvase